MKYLKLYPWPFDSSEGVCLIAVSSPFITVTGEWMFKAYFLNIKNELKQISFPWGALAELSIGYIYGDGMVTQYNIYTHTNCNVIFKSNTYQEIYEMSDVPYLLYLIHCNNTFGLEKCCKFTIGGTNYYVPCLEIIRSIYAPAKFFLNRLLSTENLDNLIEKEIISQSLVPSNSTANKSELTNSKFIEIYLTKEYPHELLKPEFLKHLVLLKYSPFFRNWWENTRNSRYSINNSPPKLHAYIPTAPKLTINFSGVKVENDFFVMKINSVTGFSLGFDYIIPKHPYLDTKYYISKTKKSENPSRPPKNEENLKLKADGGLARKGRSRLVNSSLVCNIVCDNDCKIIKRRKKDKEIVISSLPSTETTYFIKRKTCLDVTAQDWGKNGKTQPVEFIRKKTDEENLNNSKINTSSQSPSLINIHGLQNFMQLLKRYEELDNIVDLEYKLLDLKYKNSFCKLEDRKYRQYMYAKITLNSLPSFYLIEIAQPDLWEISTLLLYPKTSKQYINFNEILKQLIEILLKNNGHWDIYQLDYISEWNVITIKHHKNRDVDRWLNIISDIIKKIYYY